MERKVLLPGSYDPITRGHIDIVRRALVHFDSVHVVVFINPNKKTLFTPKERLHLLSLAFADEKRVCVGMDFGLVADYAKRMIKIGDGKKVYDGLRADYIGEDKEC